MNIKLVLTCGACPEQYDAFLDGKQVGYLRLRHGGFRVDYPTCGGETIYEAEPSGDGCFDSNERDFYLNEAKEAIAKRLKNETPQPKELYSREQMIGFAEWMDDYSSALKMGKWRGEDSATIYSTSELLDNYLSNQSNKVK